MDKIIPLGERLLSSFADEMGVSDKKIIAEKLGFQSEQSIYKIIKGERELNFDALQKFQNYTKRSIDWLLTGEGEKYLTKSQPTFNEIFDSKLTESIQVQLRRGAVAIRDISEDFQQVEYEVFNDEFTETVREVLSSVAERGREAVKAIDATKHSKFDKSVAETSSYIVQGFSELEKGEVPKFFKKIILDVSDRSRYKIDWILNNKGEKTYVSQANFVQTTFESKDLLINEFLSRINESKKKALEIAAKQGAAKKKAELRELIREIVREELDKKAEPPKSLVLPLNVGNKEEKKENKAA